MSQRKPEQAHTISGKRNNALPLQTRLVLFMLVVALVPLIAVATRDTLQTQQALANGAEISLTLKSFYRHLNQCKLVLRSGNVL